MCLRSFYESFIRSISMSASSCSGLQGSWRLSQLSLGESRDTPCIGEHIYNGASQRQTRQNNNTKYGNGPIKFANQPNVCFELWEEVRVAGENLQIPHREAPARIQTKP